MNRLILLIILYTPASFAETITNAYRSADTYCACVTVTDIPGATESLKLATDITYCSISGMVSPNDVGLGQRIVRSVAMPAKLVAGITSQKLCERLFTLIPL